MYIQWSLDNHNQAAVPMCGFFGCISDGWHSMLDRVYPNEECIVEDIDDWCVQLLQCTITSCGRKSYYCQHVWEQFGGPQFCGWTGLNLQFTRSHFICFAGLSCALRFTLEINIPLRLAVVVKDTVSMARSFEWYYLFTSVTPWPHLSKQLNVGSTTPIWQTSLTLCRNYELYVRSHWWVHQYGQQLSSPPPITHS